MCLNVKLGATEGLPISLLSLGDHFETMNLFSFRWLAAHFSDDPFCSYGKPPYSFNVAACRFIRLVAVHIEGPHSPCQAPLLRYRCSLVPSRSDDDGLIKQPVLEFIPINAHPGQEVAYFRWCVGRFDREYETLLGRYPV
jgi:hypothetical protein